MKKNIAKELLIIVLLFSVIFFTVVILFYDCFPFSDDRIKSIEYQADEKIKNTIEEVEEKSTVVTEESSNTVLKTYSVDKADLTAYNGEEYETGKQNPFEETSNEIEETVTTEATNASSSSVKGSNGSTGTFFEDENSK